MKNGEHGIEVGGWGIWKGVEWGGYDVGMGYPGGVWKFLGKFWENSGIFPGYFRGNSENSGGHPGSST